MLSGVHRIGNCPTQRAATACNVRSAPTGGQGDGGAEYDCDGSCVINVRTDANVTGIGEVDSVPSVIRAIVEAFPIDSDGMVRVPSARGLGVSVNDAAMAKFCV